MKYNRLFLLVALMLCFVTKSFSQKGNFRISNGIGIIGGITQFDIDTDNFNTKSSNGFMGGLMATVDIPLRWYNVSFGMQLSENAIEISGRPDLVSTQEAFVEYKMFAAQVAMLLHVKVIPNHFTIDFGPMLQYNGRLEFKDKNQEGYYINNYTNLSAQDITNISQFNFNGALGASLGIKNFKLKAQYVYGLTNILKKLEGQDIDTVGGDSRFKGNQTMLVLGAVLSF
ncbi:PorT family protein [Algibacter sp.]|nr:PorT family protein [Algibacter sp.]